MNSNDHKENCPCNQIIDQLLYRLNISRDKREIDLIKSVLLGCGVISISNKNNRTYAVKKQ